tara:strand:+ start:416 stop:739 length:324 start_codon:yes stop_codon:yes gene_type:complete
MKFKYAIIARGDKQVICITPDGRDESDLNKQERQHVLENVIPNHEGECVEGVFILPKTVQIGKQLAHDHAFSHGGRAKEILDYMDDAGHLDSALGINEDEDEDDYDD